MALVQLIKGLPNPVDMEVFAPPAGTVARGASLVMAYGTDGLSAASKALLEDLCRDLSRAGYTAALPRYLEATNTSAGFNSVSAAMSSANLASWTHAIVEGVNWCASHQGSNRVALIGFSLGGYMSARAAIAVPVKCLIDFFGPMTTFGIRQFPPGEAFDGKKAAKLPATQIHHGRQDIVVLPSESAALFGWLKTAGIANCELYDQYLCGHPQQPEGRPWTAVEQKQAMPDVLRFLAGI